MIGGVFRRPTGTCEIGGVLDVLLVPVRYGVFLDVLLVPVR